MARTVRPVRPIGTEVKLEKPPLLKIPEGATKTKQSRSIFLIMLAIPLFTVTSVVLYKRVIIGQPKRVQQGEYTPDGGLRIFDEEEKQEVDSKAWMTRIFGKEK